MAFMSGTQTTSLGFVDRFAAIANFVAEAYARHKMYTSTYRELAALSNRELSDLGINRTMISSIALEAAKK